MKKKTRDLDLTKKVERQINGKPDTCSFFSIRVKAPTVDTGTTKPLKCIAVQMLGRSELHKVQGSWNDQWDALTF